MTTFVTSDTHFGHERIIPLCARPFVDVDEMNETMISNFNEQASADDTIYHFGDACMGKIAETLPLISRINAKVILIPGNHDRPSKACQRKGDIAAKIAKARDMYLEHFHAVYPESTGQHLTLQGVSFAVSHYPYAGDHQDRDRFPELRPDDRGRPLLHGHVHNLWKFNGRQFNVGVDVNDFRLVHEDEVIAWAKSLPKHRGMILS